MGDKPALGGLQARLRGLASRASLFALTHLPRGTVTANGGRPPGIIQRAPPFFRRETAPTEKKVGEFGWAVVGVRQMSPFPPLLDEA